MSARLVLASAFEDPGGSVSELCDALGISRSTYYRLLAQYRARGPAGLEPRSRRPATSPGQTPAWVEDAIVRARKELADEGWDNGAWSVRQRLLRAGIPVPGQRTVHRVLVRRGLVVPAPDKAPRRAPARFEFPERNGCWQIDGMGWRLADATPAAVISVLDDHSRRTSHHAARSENSDDVWAGFCRASRRFGGLPAMLLSDNGPAINSSRRGTVTSFVDRLDRLGVKAVTSSNGHPQTCGKDERNHQSLQRWLQAHPPAEDLAGLQSLLDRFDDAFDHRPHQGLEGATPLERWTTAPKAGPAPDSEQAPAVVITTAKVSRRGEVALGRDAVAQIGIGYQGHTVAVIRRGQHAQIFSGKTLVRELEIDPGRRYQPNNKPGGGIRQQRIPRT